MARMISSTLSREGIQIIGGMAPGIDAEAERMVLRFGGRSFAVLGCGLDICYPRENSLLFDKLPSVGGLLSEYPLRSLPYGQHFPRRNQLIAALSDAVIIVEAGDRSASLLIAREALELGREVYAVPGRATDPESKGCNRLIADGAGVVLSAENLLENLRLYQGRRMLPGREDATERQGTEDMTGFPRARESAAELARAGRYR
jgi:DNA processing protein